MSNNTNKVNNPMKVITGPDTRWSYANVWEPKSINGGTRSHRPPCTGLPEQALTTVKEELGSGGVLFIHSVDNKVSGEDGTCERGEEGEYSERSKFHGKK